MGDIEKISVINPTNSCPHCGKPKLEVKIVGERLVEGNLCTVLVCRECKAFVIDLLGTVKGER